MRWSVAQAWAICNERSVADALCALALHSLELGARPTGFAPFFRFAGFALVDATERLA